MSGGVEVPTRQVLMRQGGAPPGLYDRSPWQLQHAPRSVVDLDDSPTRGHHDLHVVDGALIRAEEQRERLPAHGAMRSVGRLGVTNQHKDTKRQTWRYLLRPSTALFGSTKRQSSENMDGESWPVRMYFFSAKSRRRMAAMASTLRSRRFGSASLSLPYAKLHSNGAALAGRACAITLLARPRSAVRRGRDALVTVSTRSWTSSRR